MSNTNAGTDAGDSPGTAGPPAGGGDDGAGRRGRELPAPVPYLGIAALYFATVLGGMALADEAAAAGLAVFADPGNVANVGVFGVGVLLFTGLTLAAVRLGYGTQAIRAYVLLSVGALAAALVSVTVGVGEVGGGGTPLSGLPADPAAVAVALGTAAVLWVYPEWYVIDAAAVAFGAMAVPMLGLGFGPLPIVVLLVAWAAYDAYSVYVSGHMQELAGGLGELNLPLLFVVPRSTGFSLLDDGLGTDGGAADREGEVTDGTTAGEGSAGEGTAVEGTADGAATDGTAPDGGERSADGGPSGGRSESGDADRNAEVDAADAGTDADATDPGPDADAAADAAVLGLGDALVPGMLAVSAGQFLPAPAVVPALNANLPALGALLGGLVGLAGLLVLVHRVGGAHAGLPPLNAGVLGGYLVGAVAAGVPLQVALGL